MALLIYGVKKANIGIDEILTHCPHCEVDTFQDVLITSNYYHIYFVPIFPLEKEISFACQRCGLKRKDIPLSKQTVKNYTELTKKFRHPWFTYFATLFAGGLVLIAVMINLSST